MTLVINRSKQFIDKASLKNKISMTLMFASDLLVDVIGKNIINGNRKKMIQ